MYLKFQASGYLLQLHGPACVLQGRQFSKTEFLVMWLLCFNSHLVNIPYVKCMFKFTAITAAI